MKLLTNIIGLILSIGLIITVPYNLNEEQEAVDLSIFAQFNASTLIKYQEGISTEYKFYILDSMAAETTEDLAVQLYVKRYYFLALMEQAFHKIPASVTLGQAIVETGSSLSPPGNNHFGIKSYGKGKFFVWNDDEENEKFKSYLSARESFRNRSNLLESHRYKDCKEVIQDPELYIRCLHAAGYATDPDYSDKVIAVIDRYKLRQFDEVFRL